MRTNKLNYGSVVVALAIGVAHNSVTFGQTSWTGGGGDGDWNNPNNWDSGVPSEGVPASIGAGNVVNYNSAMAAASFGRLSSASIVNVNAPGFALDGSGEGVIGFVGAGARLFVNNGGVVSVPNGGLSLSNAAGLSVAIGGTLSVGGSLLLGRNGTGNTGFATNQGGTIIAASTQVNPNNNSSSSLLVVNGGINELGDVIVKRSGAGGTAPALGSEGLVINGGLVRMASLILGGVSGDDGNSWTTLLMTGGTVTNSGDFIMRQATASRATRFFQSGGLLVSESTNGVNLRGHGANNAFVFYSVTGGTNLVKGFLLGNPAGTDTTGTIRITNAARIYIGSAGISSVGTLNTKTIVLASGGIFGALEDWVCSEPILLGGGSFDAADLDGTPHTITLFGSLSGSGALNKLGAGALVLATNNTYTGNTVINAGTLMLGENGSISASPQIRVGSGAVLDVSSVAGFTVGSARTLSGLGTIIGDVSVSSGGVIDPGTTIPGTLSLSNSLTLSGGAVLHFDLPAAPGPGNDLLVIGGDFNAGGVNVIEIVGGGAPGTVHTLIHYAGNFNGSLTNFSIVGASGVLSNNPVTKSISLIIQTAIRSPTNLVWVGNPIINDWDTIGKTNWLNLGTGMLDCFVTGDHVRFDATGEMHPNVNLVGNNAPSAVVVDAAGDYTFGGSGAIAGTATLIKTNSGTLIIATDNTYTGPTIIGGGVLVATTLANAGSPSSIGAATADSGNLVFDGGALRYIGASTTTDRGATINAGGGTIDIANGTSMLTVNGVVTGPGALKKLGSGTLRLNAGNSHGATIIGGGTLRLDVAGAAGTGVTTNQGGTLLIAGPTVSGTISHPNELHFTGNTTIDLNNVSANTVLNGAWSGDGTVNVINQQGSTRVFTVGGNGNGGGHLWNFSGTINMGTNSGDLRFNDGGGTGSGPNFGSSNAVFNLGTGTARLLVRNGGTTTHLGALFGGPGTRLSGRGSSAGIATYRIGGKNIDATFEGTIQDTDTGSGQLTAIVKVGDGKWMLTGNSTYTGSTTVERGILQVDGALGMTPVTVSGGTLSGNGSISGPVTVQAGGTLSPGGSVGTLSIYNTLQLEPGSITLIEVDKSLGIHDSIQGLSSVFYGGTLVLSNLNGSFVAGDSFQLFSAGFYAGAFDNIVPEAPGPGLVWDTSQLSVNGTMLVASSPPVSTEPPVIQYERVGQQLELSWPETHVGWRLQVQTNAHGADIGSEWGEVEGSATTNRIWMMVDPTNGSVFFRLIYP